MHCVLWNLFEKKVYIRRRYTSTHSLIHAELRTPNSCISPKIKQLTIVVCTVIKCRKTLLLAMIMPLIFLFLLTPHRIFNRINDLIMGFWVCVDLHCLTCPSFKWLFYSLSLLFLPHLLCIIALILWYTFIILSFFFGGISTPSWMKKKKHSPEINFK